MPSGSRGRALVHPTIDHTGPENAVWRSLRALHMERQKGLCYWCERPMGPPGSGPLEVTLEHLKQRAEGGENTVENTAVSCRECNASRPAAANVLARQDKGLRDNPRLLRAAMELANAKWLEAVQARKEAFYSRKEEEPPLSDEFIGAARETVAFWMKRGAEMYLCGDAHRLIDSLHFLSYQKLLTYDEADAGRRYGRLYLEAHEIRQPWLPPSEMMEWRLERLILLQDIRKHLFNNDKRVIDLLDAVCGRGEWIVERFRGDYDKLDTLRDALAKLAECIEMTFVPATAKRGAAA